MKLNEEYKSSLQNKLQLEEKHEYGHSPGLNLIHLDLDKQQCPISEESIKELYKAKCTDIGLIPNEFHWLTFKD